MRDNHNVTHSFSGSYTAGQNVQLISVQFFFEKFLNYQWETSMSFFIDVCCLQAGRSQVGTTSLSVKSMLLCGPYHAPPSDFPR